MKGEKYLIKSVFVEIMKAKNIYIYQAYILILIDYITNLMNYSTRTEPFIFVQYKGCSDMEIWIVRFLFFLTNENIEKGNLSLLTSFNWRKWIFRSHLILDEITFKFQFYKITQLHWTGHVPIMYENRPQTPYCCTEWPLINEQERNTKDTAVGIPLKKAHRLLRYRPPSC